MTGAQKEENNVGDWICTKCNAQNREDSKFCTTCGAQKEQVQVSKSNSWFCRKCDARMITVQNIVQIAVRQKKNRKRKRKKLGLSILARNAEEHSR